jgi:hypothetical protein
MDGWGMVKGRDDESIYDRNFLCVYVFDVFGNYLRLLKEWLQLELVCIIIINPHIHPTHTKAPHPLALALGDPVSV